MSVAKRYQAEEEERNRRKILYLLLFSSSPLRYGEIKEYVGLSDAVLAAHLRELTMRGFIAKVIREGDLKPAYTLTKSGEEYLSKLYESESEEALKVKTLYDEVYQRLRNSGFAAAIQKESNVLEALTIVSPLIKIVRIFKPGKIEDEYLNFASKIYVDSVEEFLGRKKEELSYIDVRAAWQTINQNAWKERKNIPGLSFNYPAAWKINLSLIHI